MLKLLTPKFCSDLSVRLTDIAEKQVTAKPKPIVNGGENSGLCCVYTCSNNYQKPTGGDGAESTY